MDDEVHFLPTDKHECFLQVSQPGMPKLPKIKSLFTSIFAIYLGKREG